MPRAAADSLAHLDQQSLQNRGWRRRRERGSTIWGMDLGITAAEPLPLWALASPAVQQDGIIPTSARWGRKF